MSSNYKDYYLSNIQKKNCEQIARFTNAIYDININTLNEEEMKELLYSQDYEEPITSKFDKSINKCEIDEYSNLLNTYIQLFKAVSKSIVLRRRYRIDYVINKSDNEIQESITQLNKMINEYSQNEINYNYLPPTDKLIYKILYKNIRDILSYNTDSSSTRLELKDEYFTAIDKYNETRMNALTKINALIGKFNSAIEAEKIKGGSSQRKKSRSRTRSKGRSKSKRKNKSKK